MCRPTQDQLTPLWPTWVGQASLPEADPHNLALIAMANQSCDGEDLFNSEHPTCTWLKGHVSACLLQWFERMRLQPGPTVKLQARFDVLAFGEYRQLSNTPGAYLAGMYFANTPASPKLNHLRSDCLPSHLSLLDPRVGFNALALVGDRNFNETCTLHPDAGTLMLWPGYLRHHSRVHLADDPWVRIFIRVELIGALVSSAS